MATVRITKDGFDMTLEIPEELADQIVQLVVKRSVSSINSTEKRGRASAMTEEQKSQVLELGKRGVNYADISSQTGASYWSVRRYLKAEGY